MYVHIDSDMCSCPSKMYIIVRLLKLTCGKYFDGINCELFTTGKFSYRLFLKGICAKTQCTPNCCVRERVPKKKNGKVCSFAKPRSEKFWWTVP